VLTVDFVIAGILLGALAVAIGETIRIVGPRRSPAERRSLRRGADPTNATPAWLRTCQALGMLLTTAGAALLLVTMILTLANASDRVGWIGVGLFAAIGIPGCLLASWLILNRYRSGGFDLIWIEPAQQAAPADAFESDFYDVEPASWTPPIATAIAAAIKPESTPLQSAPSAELFEEPMEANAPVALDAAATSVVSAEPAVVGDDVPEVSVPEVPMRTEEKTAAIVETPAPEPVVPVEVSVRQRISQQVPRQVETPAPPVEWTAPQIAAAEPARRTPLPEFATPNFDLPLIDLDDELPAWNAPAAAAPPPKHSRPAQVVIEQTELEIPTIEDPGGFQSSLLADIAPIADATTPGADGKFASRLLNELTADDRRDPGQRTDVVLDVRPNSGRNR